MPAYLGIQSQIRRNNRNSIFLLIMFPLLILGMVWVFTFVVSSDQPQRVNQQFLLTLPWVILGVGLWFTIAYFSHTSLISMATGSKPLERSENKRVYNLVENLCISQGMKMPKIFIIEDNSMNAFASGIDEKSFALTFSRGILKRLPDAELEAVIGHELTHIKNRDVRLLIISIVFVGIFAFLSQIAFRSFLYGGGRRSSRNDKGAGALILVAIIITAVAYFISILLRFGISRKREYMADAGSAEMTRNPKALASALRMISTDPIIENVKNSDVAQLFIENPQKKRVHSFSFSGLFSTHPPIEDRIKILENF